MSERFSRTERMFGSAAMEKLKSAHVAVFGIGGVGGYVVEALARSGIGVLDLIDNDTVNITNINRQIIALNSTVGMYKTDVAAARIKEINPEVKVNKHICFYLPENAHEFDFSEYDYVVDAIDTVSGKISIAVQAQLCGVPVISSMGTGNKINPSMLRVADIYDTKVCPLARVMRHELRKRDIKSLKVVYSEEEPIKTDFGAVPGEKLPPASNAFVPSAAGLIIAAEVVKDIIGIK